MIQAVLKAQLVLYM